MRTIKAPDAVIRLPYEERIPTDEVLEMFGFSYDVLRHRQRYFGFPKPAQKAVNGEKSMYATGAILRWCDRMGYPCVRVRV